MTKSSVIKDVGEHLPGARKDEAQPTGATKASDAGDLPSVSEWWPEPDDDQKITLVTDGNPSYPAGIHFINAQVDDSATIQHKKVIGLQNLDAESEEYRPYKQLIERLNRTYKYHVRPAAGFNCTNGAVSLTTLFVTHYNFLRPHMSLQYQPPIPMLELKKLPTIQARWTKILSLAA